MTYCRELCGLTKNVYSERERKQLFTAHLTIEHCGSYCIFTDGSKTEEGVGYTCISDSETIASRLPNEASIFTAELVAIREALKICSEREECSFTVCSDSRSSLAAIEHRNSTHPIVSQIQSHIIQLRTRQKQFKLCWVPRHVGLSGNEQDDSATKEIITSGEVEVSGLPHKNYYPIIKSKIKQMWKHNWSETTSNKLREIREDISEWPSSQQRDRRTEISLCRLRIGHTLTTHQ